MITTSDKAIQLFTYLKELSKLRTTHKKDISNYDEVLWFSDIPKEKGCSCIAWELWDSRDNENEDRGNVWVEIHKPTLKSPPEVPDELEPWIKVEDISNSDLNEPELSDEITIIGDPDSLTGEEIRETRSINDYPDVFDIWMKYTDKDWKSWAEEDRRLQRVQKVYNNLYTIYQLSEKLGEQYEVVIGIGFLVWQSPTSGEVRHPLLTLNARVDFDRVRGIMSVGPAADGPQPRLEIDMLESDDRPSVTDQQAIEEMAAELDGGPWNPSVLEAILKALANGISTESRYENDISRPAQISNVPQLHFAPLLILRKRTRRTFVDFYHRILEQLQENGDVPDGVRRLVEIVEDTGNVDERDPNEYTPQAQTCYTELYFPLPTNEEQRRIAQRIEQHQGVLVQGPPGTGKSHTIANLVSHLLAKGQRVLVTSETPRALEVLKNMLPKEIRELCVMWLGSGPKAQESLEQSVHGITQKKLNWEPEHASREIAELEHLLDQSRSNQAKCRNKLTACREADTYQHTDIFGMYNGTLEKIAININKDREKYGWLKDRPSADEEPGVTSEELIKLLSLKRQLTGDLVNEIKMRQVPLDLLTSEDEFKDLVDTEKHAIILHENAEKKRNYPGYDSLLNMSPEIRARMLDFLKNLIGNMEKLSKHFHVWAEQATREIVADQDRVWRQLLETTEECLQKYADHGREISALKIIGMESRDFAEVVFHARELKAHLDSGKGLGIWLFRAKAVKQAWYLIKQVRVDGEPCISVKVLQKLLDWLELDRQLKDLANLWERYSKTPEGNYTAQLAAYEDFCEPLRDALDLHGIVQELKRIISQLPGLASPHWHVREEVETLCDAVEVVDIDEKLLKVRERFTSWEEKLKMYAEYQNSHPSGTQLLNAIRTRDLPSYRKVCDIVLRMNQFGHTYQLCCNIWKRFKNCAPKTAEEYANTIKDEIWSDRFENFYAAWNWAKADRWMSEMCKEDRAKQLTDDLESFQADELDILKELAAKKAWQHCMAALGEKERQALMAWMQAVNRIGRGTGRHAERYREEARQKLEECRRAIPAWVMPLYQVVQTTSPNKSLFDVVIVDEASQSGPEALLLTYIGKKIIVVGDDKQIAPLYVGINRDDVVRLRRMHLQGIPHNEAFDLEGSLFSQAELRYPGIVRLREHFRCMPEIIQFSNKLFYSTEPLIPLRQFGADRLQPCRTTHIEEGYRTGRSPNIENKPEAKALVEQVIQCLEDPAYEKKSFGVISLLGKAQSQLISNMLMQEVGAEEMEKRSLLCGNPYDFQGDERDVIFLSMVDATQDGKMCQMVRDRKNQRVFNVAASRAKDQLWLFHSPTLNDLRTECLRYRLLEHCLNPHVEQTMVGDIDVDELRQLATSERRGRIQQPAPFDSWFEVDVFLRIAERGYRVLPQYEVAGKKIDLVIEGLEGKLAVECDGDEFHGPERYNDDMERQRELERCGWIFWRVRGYQFYRVPDVALQSLWELLEQRHIYPEQQWEKERQKKEEAISQKDHIYVDYDDEEIETESSSDAEVGVTLDRSYDDKLKGKKSLDNISSVEIRHAIISALKKCPNHSCTIKSITSRVLKELGIITRGNPRMEFERRVLRNIGILKQNGRVEEYRAKNRRLRFCTRV